MLQCPSGAFIHPSGVEKSLQDCISSLRTCYGDKQGKQFRIWVDQVIPVQVGSDSWLVRFKRWELSGTFSLPNIQDGICFSFSTSGF